MDALISNLRNHVMWSYHRNMSTRFVYPSEKHVKQGDWGRSLVNEVPTQMKIRDYARSFLILRKTIRATSWARLERLDSLWTLKISWTSIQFPCSIQRLELVWMRSTHVTWKSCREQHLARAIQHSFIRPKLPHHLLPWRVHPSRSQDINMIATSVK